jgi:hypothetical protein
MSEQEIQQLCVTQGQNMEAKGKLKDAEKYVS